MSDLEGEDNLSDHAALDEESKNLNESLHTAFDARAHEKWKSVVDKATPAIVTINSAIPIAFEEEGRGVFEATGFVVDKTQGLILTNRHVILCGPIIAEATFTSKEVVPLTAWYRDPVHDFGFFKFDPSLLKQQSVQEIALYPQGARVGVDICVIGNDDGEKRIVLPGVLAVLDRSPPYYDMNTFYYAAANNTSGGSSGSPVLNLEGCAIALNSGSKAASLFLPLHGITRALHVIQHIGRGCMVEVPRGDLHVEWKYITITEASQLSIKDDVISDMLASGHQGMLAATKVLKFVDQSRAPLLKVGDVLIEAEGNMVSDYYTLENLLNNAVGHIVNLRIQRGSQLLDLAVRVQDLEEHTPKSLYQASGSTFHAIPYMQAINYGAPIDKGIFIAEAKGMFRYVGPHNMLTMFGSVKLSSLEDFVDAMDRYDDGDRVVLRWSYLSSAAVTRSEESEVIVEKKWHPYNCYYSRNDRTGMWDRGSRCVPRNEDSPADEAAGNRPAVLIDPLAAHLQLKPQQFDIDTDMDSPKSRPAGKSSKHRNRTKFVRVHPEDAVMPGDSEEQKSKSPFSLFMKRCTSEVQRLMPSLWDMTWPGTVNAKECLFLVEFTAPFPFQGLGDGSMWYGVGMLVDTARGLIAVSRYQVPHALGSITCRLLHNRAVTIPAKLVFIHPIDYYCLLAYDVNHPNLKDIPLKAPTVNSSLPSGRWLFTRFKAITLTGNHFVTTTFSAKLSAHASITKLKLHNFAYIGDIDILDVGENYGSGIVCQYGRVVALAGNFSGLKNLVPVAEKPSKQNRDANIIISSLPNCLSQATLPQEMFVLPFRYIGRDLLRVKAMGLSEAWIKDIKKNFQKSPTRVLRQKLFDPYLSQVGCITPRSAACSMVQPLDVILKVNGRYLFSYFELHRATTSFEPGTVDLTVLRNGEIVNIDKVPLHRVSSQPEGLLVLWAGLVIEPIPDFFLDYLEFDSTCAS